MIDFVAQSPISIEASAGITETAWYRTPAASGSAESGAVYTRDDGEPDLGGSSHGRSRSSDSVLRKMWSLMRLEPGWDSFGAQAVSARAVEVALAFLVQSAARPRPSLVPTTEGGIQLEWHIGSIDIEIECMPSGHAQLLGEDADSAESVERWVTPGHIAVDDWLAKLSIQG